jgi:argininosuccinate lyase
MIRLMKPEESIKTREVPGGTGPESVARALGQAKARIAEWRP